MGSTDLPDGSTHAFIYSNGKMADIGTLGGTVSVAYGVNGSSEVVGWSYLPGDTSYHAFGYRSGVMYDLGTLGGDNSAAHSINSSGTVVGFSYLADNSTCHAFISSAGNMSDLDTLNAGENSTALCINYFNDVVGVSGSQAFIYRQGDKMRAIPGVANGAAYGVDYTGYVVGSIVEGGHSTGFFYGRD